MILVGDAAEDPHVRAVADLLSPRGLVILDATRLGGDIVHRLGLHNVTLVDVNNQLIDVSLDAPGRGWLRRLAPAGWDRGVVLGSHQAAVLSSRLALLAAILRDRALSWVTSVDDLFAAENKLVQYRAAISTGVRVPHTVVSGDPRHIVDELGEPFVMKPLGPGNFEDGGRHHVVYVRKTWAADLDGTDLLDAPFLAQEIIATRLHLRVVTVQQRAWVAELNATGLPVDWREHAPAHRSFTAVRHWPDIERAAVALAGRLRVGFSCQDWLVDKDGPVFLDLNPGGQWLFLPDELTRPVAQALADWLAGR